MAGPAGASPSQTTKTVRPAAPGRAAPAVRAARAQSASTTPPAASVAAVAPATTAPAASSAADLHGAGSEAGTSAGARPAATPVESESRPSEPRELQALFYGALVVLAGFVAILIGLALVLLNIKTSSDATAMLGVITTAVAGLGGAFFGITVGQQGTASANKDRAAAEAAKDEAQMRTIRFAAHMDPAVARRLVD